MIYFLIPAYNEDENFSELMKNISKSLKKSKRIIIVDDGSNDSTVGVLKKLSKKYPVTRIGYRRNRGAGYAFKYGFEYLIPKLKADDLVISMESDNTGDFSVINKMINLASKNDIVLASPHAKGGSFVGVGDFRVFLSKISSICDSQVFRVKSVKTYSSFYRVYTAKILEKMVGIYDKDFITNTGFSAVVEILIKAKKTGAKIIEVPAVVDWNKRKGKSKMNILKNARGHFALYRDYYLGKFG